MGKGALTTEKVISDMLKENTGTHFLDSGGAYGRHWERNKDRDFAKEPYAIVKFDTYGDGEITVDYTQNLYHYLVDALDFSPKWTNKFRRWANKKENEDTSYLVLMEKFMDLYATNDKYGERPGTYNSYNDDNCLSQTIQLGRCEVDDGTLILLQIHGGCDVRGGYTEPRCFYERDEWAALRWGDGHIYCDNDYDHNWYTDDAYNWYWGGYVTAESLRDGQIPLFEHDKCSDKVEWLNRNLDFKKLEVSESWEFGKMYIDEDGNGYCPVCGGKLMV